VYIAIGAMFAFMGGIVYYSTLDFPELEKSEIELLSVDIVEIDSIENRMYLELVFGVTNYGERTVTVPEISFELFANGKSIGTSSYSVEDIPMTGRAPFYPGAEIPLDSYLKISLTESNSDEYLAIVNGEFVEFSVKGQYTIETAWQLIEKEFESSL